MLKKFFNSKNYYGSLQPLIADWNEYREKLKIYYSGRFVLDDDFLYHFGNSFSAVSILNTSFINILKQASRNKKNTKDDEKTLKNLAKILLYHNNLILSRIRHNLFQELAANAENQPYYQTDNHLTKNYYNILEYVNKLENNIFISRSKIIKKIKNELMCMCVNLTLCDQFIYQKSDNCNNGKFLFFQFNHKVFLDFGKKLENIKYINPNSSREYTEILLKINENILGDALNGSELNKYIINKNDNITIEPYSWYIINIIWKSANLLKQAAIEDLNKEKYKKTINDYSEKTITYVTNVFKILNTAYIKNKMWDSSALYEAILPMLDATIRDDENKNVLFYAHDIKEFMPSGNIFKKLEKYYPTLPEYIITKHKSTKKLENEYNNNYHEESDIKIEKQISEMPLSDFNNNLSEMASFFWSEVKENNYKPEEIMVVGIGASGHFLAHILKLFKPQELNSFEYYIWNYYLYPYVALMPYHKNNSTKSKIRKIFIIDEVIKTGLTVSTLPDIINRINDMVVSDNYKIICLSLVNLKTKLLYITKNIEFYAPITAKRQNKKHKYNKEIIKLNYNSSDSYKTWMLNIKSEVVDVKPEFNDLNILASYSNAYLFYVNKFIDVITSKKTVDNKKINNHYFYASSSVGRSLSIAVFWLLKNQNIDNICVLSNNIKPSEEVQTDDAHWWFDMAIHSGETKKHFINKTTNVNIKLVNNLLLKNSE